MLQRKDLYMENIAIFRPEEKNIFDKNQLYRLEEELLEKGVYLTGPMIWHNRDMQNTDYELLLPVNRQKELMEEGQIRFYDQVVYEGCVYLRKLLEEGALEGAMQAIEEELNRQGFWYREVFYVILNIPGGKVIDIYVPTEGEKQV